jgi:hypothetical protein
MARLSSYNQKMLSWLQDTRHTVDGQVLEDRFISMAQARPEGIDEMMKAMFRDARFVNNEKDEDDDKQVPVPKQPVGEEKFAVVLDMYKCPLFFGFMPTSTEDTLTWFKVMMQKKASFFLWLFPHNLHQSTV